MLGWEKCAATRCAEKVAPWQRAGPRSYSCCTYGQCRGDTEFHWCWLNARGGEEASKHGWSRGPLDASRSGGSMVQVRDPDGMLHDLGK